MLKRKKFFVLFSVTVIFCITMVLYCLINGRMMASSHMEPQYTLRNLQLFAAAIIAVCCRVFAKGRNHWYIIPIVLASVSFLYTFIVNQYPCCVGG